MFFGAQDLVALLDVTPVGVTQIVRIVRELEDFSGSKQETAVYIGMNYGYDI